MTRSTAACLAFVSCDRTTFSAMAWTASRRKIEPHDGVFAGASWPVEWAVVGMQISGWLAMVG